MKKSLFVPKNVTELVVGDQVHVYGEFMEVKKLHRVYIQRPGSSPIELMELWVEGIQPPLRVPAGWQVKVPKPVSLAERGLG